MGEDITGTVYFERKYSWSNEIEFPYDEFKISLFAFIMYINKKK